MKTPKETAVEYIRRLSDAKSPSGFEDETIAAVRGMMDETFTLEEDSLRNLYVSYASKTADADDDRPVFMLDAHGDEVGMMVQFIRPNGLIGFLPLGGWSLSSFPASKVRIRNRDGIWIPGVVAEKPPHFRTAAERGQISQVADLSIDIGAMSDQDAIENYGIEVGQPVVSAVTCEYDEIHDTFLGKAFDDRIGVAVMLETMRRLEGEKLPVALKAVVSSQEEVGERGVGVAVRRIKPDVAICFEGCPADDTFQEAYKIQAGIRRGPMIRYMDVSMIANPRYMRDTVELAKREGIPVQTAVRSGGGNNGAIVNLAEQGIPVIVISVPVRYIHSHYCIATYADYEQAVQLACTVVQNMTWEKLRSF